MSYNSNYGGQKKDPMITFRSTLIGKTKDGSKDTTTLFVNRDQAEALYSALQEGLNSSPTAEVTLSIQTGEKQTKDGQRTFLSSYMFVKFAEPRDQNAPPKPKLGFKPRAVAPSAAPAQSGPYNKKF